MTNHRAAGLAGSAMETLSGEPGPATDLPSMSRLFETKLSQCSLPLLLVSVCLKLALKGVFEHLYAQRASQETPCYCGESHSTHQYLVTGWRKQR